MRIKYIILYNKIILQHFSIILIGILIFYIDEIGFLNPFYPQLILIIIAIIKTVYFLGHSFKKIEEASLHNITYNRFLLIIIINISLVVLSFAVDYTCLYLINGTAFLGLENNQDLLGVFFDFNYFSILTFATVGYGDIVPVTKSAKLLVIFEVILSFVTIIIIISNFAHVKESAKEFSFLKIGGKSNKNAEAPGLDKVPRKPLDNDKNERVTL